MGSKVVAFLGLFVAIVFVVSSQVALARELAQPSNTITTSEARRLITIGSRPLKKKPIIYGPPKKSPKRRKCDYKNKCRPPAQPEH